MLEGASIRFVFDVCVVEPVAEAHPGEFEAVVGGRVFGFPHLDGQILPEAVKPTLRSRPFSPEGEAIVCPVLPLVRHFLYGRGVGEEGLDVHWVIVVVGLT